MPSARLAIILFATLGLLTLLPHAAGAHAILMDSQPASGATVASGATHVVLRYNSRIDQARSRLELRGAGRPAAVLRLTPSSDDTLAADVALSSGAWTLRWQVLAVDGHITRGEVPLTVDAAPGAAN